MKYFETFLSAIKNILSHKLRSSLTLLGIVLGVVAVTTMISSVAAIKQIIEDAISSLGYDNVIILYSSFPSSEKNLQKKYPTSNRFKNLTYRDFEILKENLEDIDHIYPSIYDEKVCVINGKKKQTRIYGIENIFFKSKNYPIANGRMFNHLEENNGQNVCILGSRLNENFFPEEDALGKFVSIGNFRLKIIGVLRDDKFSEGGGIQVNSWERRREHESCFIPAKCAAKYLRQNMRVDNIFIKSQTSEKVGEIFNQSSQIIAAHHNMADDIEIKDINEQMLEIRETTNSQMKNWSIILICITGISLFTGGIGLFSILLISIRERMKEIGIRKSIGAKNQDIFFHFLFESITLALIAGIIGSGLAFGLMKFLSSKVEFAVSIPMIGIVVGLIFAIFVGLISGLYPAYKASKINPVQAIFYTE
ncbi:MAG: ABC transporter permease [Candidatus Cloacimonetes bacterium]|nr:ABC transporter permease [Candidatus Cloacimonadota bacterium]